MEDIKINSVWKIAAEFYLGTKGFCFISAHFITNGVERHKEIA